MDLAVVIGQRVGDLCRMKWEDIRDGYIYVEQEKTGSKLAIPVKLSVELLDISLEESLKKCKESLKGETIIASTRCESLSSGTISRYFMRARKSSGILFDGEPRLFMNCVVCQPDSMRSKSARNLLSTFSDISRTAWHHNIAMTEGRSGTKLKYGNDLILTDSDLATVTT